MAESRCRAELSRSGRQDHRAVRRRRAGRRLCALHRPAPAGNPQAVVRSREPAWRRLGDRHQRGGQVAARRLHAADDVQHPHRQRDAQHHQVVRPDARLRAGGARQLLRPRYGRASDRRGQGPEGVHRPAEGQAGRAQLCLLGRRHALSHGRRAVQSHERDQHRARAAPGQRRSPHQHDRRPRADDVRCRHHHGRERQGRPGAGARHVRRRRARLCCRTCRPSPRPACRATTPPSGSA